MAETFKIEGLAALEKTLAELPKATGKGALRRVLRQRAAPVADAMRADAARASGDLQDSIGHGTRLSPRQRALHRRWGTSSAVEYFIGAGPLPQAITEEFGTFDQAPRPFARPNWDAHRYRLLDGLKQDLWAEITKSAERRARKLARQKGG